jgi:predicted ester cyclase
MKKDSFKTSDVFDMNLHIARRFLETPMAIPLAEDIVLQDLAQGCIYENQTTARLLLLAFFVEGFSDVRLKQQTLLADAKAAMVEFIFYGCHTGIFMTIPATGQRVCVPMVLVFQIAENCIHHITWYYDAGTLLRQLGLAL